MGFLSTATKSGTCLTRILLNFQSCYELGLKRQRKKMEFQIYELSNYLLVSAILASLSNASNGNTVSSFDNFKI